MNIKRKTRTGKISFCILLVTAAVFISGCYCGTDYYDYNSDWSETDNYEDKGNFTVSITTEGGNNRAYQGEDLLITVSSDGGPEPVAIKLIGNNETLTIVDNYSGPYPFTWTIPSNYPSGESYRIMVNDQYFIKESDQYGYSGEFAILENSSTGLSDISVSSPAINITLIDNGTVIDGDTVSISLNGVLIAENHVLTASPGTEMTLNLTAGVNTLEITAVNEGSVSPNTAEIRFTDVTAGEAVQQWRLNTGQTGGLTISAPF